ncbi:hypothetical protein N431DRAFT_449933 [Stipitochalara longipes BDJ]|nr:hypothetical protein N431DRAFT_449933 [Stipitochalara longipes BDJ]
MASLPSNSTLNPTPGQGSRPEPSRTPTTLDRQLILRQIAMVCTSVQLLAETLTSAYISAVEPPRNSGTIQQFYAPTIANQLDSLTMTLKTLADSLLAASETAIEFSEIKEEVNEIEEADEGYEIDQESYEPLLLSSFAEDTSTTPSSRECSLWLQATVEENTWSQLTCMGNACDELLQHADWQRLASAELFEKYDDFITKIALGQNPDFRNCLGPGCKSGHEHIPGPEGALAALFVCDDCGHRSCATHNIPWHEGESCEEYHLRMDPAIQETASLVEIPESQRSALELELNLVACALSRTEGVRT